MRRARVVNNPSEFAERFVEINARKAGPRLGAKVQELIRAGKAGEFKENRDGTITILGEILSPEEAHIVYRGKEGQVVASEQGIVVSLDTLIDSALTLDGQARDLIRAIQTMRKNAGMTMDQVATIAIEGADELLRMRGDLILRETKATLAPRRGSGSSSKKGKARAQVTTKLGEASVTVSLRNPL